MDIKKHAPLIAATISVIAAQIICTTWLVFAVLDARGDSRKISATLTTLKQTVESIEFRTLPRSEQLSRLDETLRRSRKDAINKRVDAYLESQTNFVE